MNFFNEMINKIINNTSNKEILINNIITPFSGYYISNYYIGSELIKYNLPNTSSINLLELCKFNKIYLEQVCHTTKFIFKSEDSINYKLLDYNIIYEIDETNCIFKTEEGINNFNSIINDYDIIYVQVNYFDFFCSKILNNLNKKIILITGQWHLPKLNISENSNKLLTDEKIYFWFSQNPIYNNNKYFAFPYGINYGYDLNNPSICIYAKYLVNNHINKFEKKNIIINLPMDYNTNSCRSIFEKQDYISYDLFCNKLIESKFILSPIGDRDDCYRHWEAIGYNTIPISNVNSIYKELFEDNMYYVDNTKTMINMLNNDNY